jgi:hypothetical protein
LKIKRERKLLIVWKIACRLWGKWIKVNEIKTLKKWVNYVKWLLRLETGFRLLFRVAY